MRERDIAAYMSFFSEQAYIQLIRFLYNTLLTK